MLTDQTSNTPPIIYPLDGKRVWVAGHRGMVGQAIVRRLDNEGCEVIVAGRDEVDLKRQAEVEGWMAQAKPDAVFVAAAKVGGILANDTYPADFLYDNLMIQANIVEAAYRTGVGKLMLLGSSCIYPKFAPQPIREDALLTGPLEPTNEWYAIAKIAGIKLGQAYRRQHGFDVISAMPTNLYGPGDNFDLNSSHVLPALIRKAHEAKVVGSPSFTIWGTGSPRREFLHSDDCADACLHLMKVYTGTEHINVGSGKDVAILELAELVARIVGFDGEIVRDTSKPDGTPRKLMSAERLRSFGWAPRISLEEGVCAVYAGVKERLGPPVGANALGRVMRARDSHEFRERRRALIYCINYAPEMIGVGRYAGELGAYLAGDDVELEVVTTPPHYPGWKVTSPFNNQYSTETRGGARVFRCPMWLKPEMNGMARMLAPFSFALSSAPVVLVRALARCPDVLIATEPGLFTAPMALLAARLAGAKAVLHVQDLEVEAAFAVRHLKGRRIQVLARAFDRAVLRQFDEVVTISERMREALLAAGSRPERTVVVRNWVDLSKIRPQEDPNSFRAELGIPLERCVVLYAGNIGAKQALDCVVDAADRLRTRNNVLFVIAGEGPEKDRLIARAGENVLFLPLQPEERLCELLNLADVHVLPQHSKAADLVLPSKLGGMLASGKPIVYQAETGTELSGFLSGAGSRARPGDIDDLLSAIEDALVKASETRFRRSELASLLSSKVLLPEFSRVIWTTLEDRRKRVSHR